MTLHKCSFCEGSKHSNDERLSHEKICIKNYTLTDEERIKNKLELNQKNNKQI